MGQEEAEDAATALRRSLRDPAWEAAFDVDGEFTGEQKKEAIRVILLDYAWLPGDTAEQKAANVDCIMAQDGWEYVQARADQFAGAQFEPGPAAFDAGIMNEVTALYECHDGHHLDTCPRKPEGGQ